MKNLFILLLLSIPTFGQSVDLSKLPLDKQQQILQLAQQANQSAITPENVSKWVEIGNSIGVAIGATAKQLNVEANAFAQTPLGKFTMFLIAWKFFGEDILSLVVSVSILLIGIKLLHGVFRQRYTYIYEYVPYFWGAFSVQRIKEKLEVQQGERTDSENSVVVFYCLLIVAGFFATCVSLAN